MSGNQTLDQILHVSPYLQVGDDVLAYLNQPADFYGVKGVPTVRGLQAYLEWANSYRAGPTVTAVTASSTRSPANESAAAAIDGSPSSKYLNYDKEGSGLVLTVSAQREAEAARQELRALADHAEALQGQLEEMTRADEAHRSDLAERQQEAEGNVEALQRVIQEQSRQIEELSSELVSVLHRESSLRTMLLEAKDSLIQRDDEIIDLRSELRARALQGRVAPLAIAESARAVTPYDQIGRAHV